MNRLDIQNPLGLFALVFVATAWCVSDPPSIAVNAAIVWSYVSVRARSAICSPLSAGFAAALVCILLAADRDRPDRFAHGIGESRMEGELVARVLDGPLLYPGGRFRYRLQGVRWDGAPMNSELSLFAEHLMWPGETVRVWTRIQRPARASFVGPGARERLARSGVFIEGSAREAPVVLRRDFSFWRPVAQARHAHVVGILRELPADLAAHAIALTTGHKAFVSDARSEAWNVSGTGHLLAISGLHFGMLAAAVWGAMRWVLGWWPTARRRWGTRRVAAPIVAVVLAIALAWVGGPASARRAFALVIAGAVAVGVLRRVTPSRLLALAAVAVAAGDPTMVRDLGYQLSFAATASIVFALEGPFATDPVAEDPTPWQRALRFLALSTAASAATAPILAHHLGTVPVGGFWANLWAIPMVAAVGFPLIVIGSLVAPLSPEFGYPVMEAGAWTMELVAMSVEMFAGPQTQWVCGRVGVVVALFSLIAVLVACGTRRQSTRATAVLVTVVVVVVVRPQVPDRVEVHAIPVGQGDATLVRFPDGTTMLIDAGGSTHGRDPGSRIVVPYLWSLGISRVDQLVVTHPDHDHVGGLDAVARNIEVGAVVHDRCFDDRRVRSVRRLAGGEVVVCGALEWGQDWRVRVVRPAVTSESKNERSLIVEVTWRGARVLMTGDAEQEAEAWWAERLGRRATVLKLGHHGSNTSSTAGFLDVVDPVAAFASAGRFSRFGHPSPEVVERVEARGAAIGSSARDGLIVWEIRENGAVAWRSRHPPPLVVQASVRRKTSSTGSSSRSGDTDLTPYRDTTAETNL